MSVEGGVYWIRNLQWNNKVLDLSGGNLAHGTRVVNFNQHDIFNKPLNQLWLVERFDNRNKYIIRNVHSNLVLDLGGGSSASGTPILCCRQDSGTNQQWRIEWSKDVDSKANYHIINAATGTAVSHNQNDSVDFTVGWSVDGGHKQLWSFTPFICSLTYRLRVKSTGRVLDLTDASPANGTPSLAFDQHTATTKRNQLWRLQSRLGSESYTIQCLETGTVADLLEGNTGNGTAICGWQPNGGRNQQWKMDTLAADYQKITNVAGGSVMDAYLDDDRKRVGGWQSHGSDNQQWFLDAVPSPGAGWVLIQNGRFLRQLSSRPSISSVETTENTKQDWWLLETYKDSDARLVSIISAETSNSLDHYAGETVEALDTATDNPYRSWKIMPANDWLTSFSLINGERGLCLSAQRRREGIELSTVNDLDDFHAQWIFRKVAEGPLYSIQNKANNYILGGSAARWQLVVRCEKYFGVRDYSTGKYLALEDHQPTFRDRDMSDRHQCWELASGRTNDGLYDLIYMDDDLLEVLVPFLNSRETPKDKSEWKLPSKDRVAEPDNQTVRQLLEALIDRWEWDVVNEEPQPIQTLISFGQAEAERVIGQRLPQSIRRIYANSRQPDTVFRLDRQGYVNMAGGRYVNLQGQYGTNTYFHITLPVGVRYGREEIRRFMRESLRRSTSIVVTPATCKPPDGGPPYKRDPGSGGGNSWIKWALTLLTISTVHHSEL